MNKYRIKVNYDTGNSFGTSHDQEEYISMSWNNLDIAKQNLKFIDAHYKLYKQYNSWDLGRLSNKGAEATKEKLLNDASKEVWFSDFNGGERKIYWEFQIMLRDDDGKLHAVSTSMWIGYFEKLNYAEIEVDKDVEGMRIGRNY